MGVERSIEELERDARQKLIIDIRGRDSFAYGSYPGAENIPLPELDPEALAADATGPVYLMCQIGRQSLEAAETLAELGCEAYSVAGGYAQYLSRRMDAMASDEALREERQKKAERSIIKKFRKELWGPFTKALNVYKLVEPGDKIAVCVSGGKDSMLMAKLFQELYLHGERNFELVFLVMDPGYNEVNMRAVTENARLLGVPIRTFRTEIFDIVAGESGSPCYLCARMRRGYLYSNARELGCNKIALGHHFDDVIETTLMSMLYGGQIQTMLPKLHSKNFPGMELIRPMYLIREADIIRWRNYNDLRFIQCACRLTESCASCGGTEQGSKRAEIKRLIARLKETNPQVESSIFRSMENVCLDAVIAYKQGGERHTFLDGYASAAPSDGE